MLKRFFGNAALIAAAELIVRAKGLVLVPLLSRHLGPQSYGTWTQALLITALFAPLVVLGTDAAAMRFISGEPEERQKRQFSAWLTLLTATAVVVAGALVLVRNEVALVIFGSGNEFRPLVIVATFAMITGVFASSARAWFRVRNDAAIWAAANVSQAGLSVLAGVAVVLRGEGVYEFILYTMVGDALVALWLLALIYYRYGFSVPDFAIVPRFLRFGLPLLPAAYAMACLNLMDRLFLVHYTTMEAIGIYSVVYSLGYLVIQVVTNPIWAMYPSVAAHHYNRGETEQIISLSRYSIGIILTLVIPAVVGLSLLGRPILMLFTTPAFANGAPLMPVITVGYCCLILSSYFDVALGLSRRQYLSTVSILIAALVNLFLNVILIPPYGITGAAIATTTAFFCQLIASFVFSRRFLRFELGAALPLRVLAASAGMGCCVWFLKGALPPTSLALLAFEIVFGAIVYAAMAAALGVVPAVVWNQVAVFVARVRGRRA